MNKFHDSPGQIIRKVFNLTKNAITVDISGDYAKKELSLLKDILGELKIMNTYLSEITEEEIETDDNVSDIMN